MSYLSQIQVFVEDLFHKNPNPNLLYHHLEHTQTVVQQCQNAAKTLNFSSKETSILLAAAWLHDIGYLFTFQKHEAKSIEIARPYLLGINFDYIEEVIICIEGTEVGVEPQSQLAALLKDIDAAYGLYTNFKEKGDAIRQEWSLTINKNFTDMEWTILQKQFLKNFQWFSQYGQKNFQKNLAEWIYRIDNQW